ncbi:MAG: hemerythrin family protein [Desulfamplus sp.]|nr:hemerythrin family protein [Desulfamplus sp.]MBF0412723.1 hemerythrin family protein [Desulfamplus sp.]
MSKIIWSEFLSVENEEIDNQHKNWIEIFNTSYDRMMGKDYSTLSQIGVDALINMQEYTDMHFAFEEKYMQEINYPDAAEHKLKHDFFRIKLKRIRQDFDNGNPKLNSEVMKIIETWFVEHIQREDQKYNLFKKKLMP